MSGAPSADDKADSRHEATADGAGEDRDVADEGRWRHRLKAARELGRRIRERLTVWWRGFQAFLDGLEWPEQPPPLAARTLLEQRVTRPMFIPAQGWVYGFVVQATFTWSSETARPEVFGWYVDMFQPEATQRLRRLAAQCARDVAPHRVRTMETALQDALAQEPSPWVFPGGDQTYSCQPDVTVRLDPRVRRLLQPYWDQRIALECERDLARRRAGYAEDRHGPAPMADPDTPPPRRTPRPDSPVEQFTPLEPFPPQAPPPTRRPEPRGSSD